MIGVVGSADSAARLQQVARDLSMTDQVLVRSYDALEQAAELAAELDGLCNVLLFTGLVPYQLTAERRPGLHSRTQYVPHGGIDLYRTLALLLAEHRGTLPATSLDTIPADLAREGFEDLGLTAPRHILALEAQGSVRVRSSDDVALFHRDLYKRGEVALCITCLGSVARELQADGIPVVRVEHTRSALRDSLIRAALTDRIVRGEDTQTAVVGIQLAPGTRLSRRLRSVATALADQLQGTPASGPDGLLLVHATRGPVERLLARHRWEWWRLVGGLDAPAGTKFGFGVGATVSEAETNARRSMQLDTTGDQLRLVLSDGAIVDGSAGSRSGGQLGSLRQTDDRVLAHAREIGLSSLTLARLAASLRHLDVTGFTARELAEVYGVETRSARRLLTTLIDAGVAREAGHQGAPGAGRPQTVYRIDLERLLPRE
ncbi:MAG TPA: hypothetical protein VFJ94_02580 [Intrasporangium sp.]|uniref:hypothetical protein n=1 Tax=Intrasporangium sp. TaxID=1925024 RepID=UPI002D7A30AA|nr:hypothetical protein [Intrasporangium sp.]HET7397384.1 hypothetical protein [Intrasporangium sp.]